MGTGSQTTMVLMELGFNHHPKKKREVPKKARNHGMTAGGDSTKSSFSQKKKDSR